MRCTLAPAIAVVIALAACERDVYTVRMQPTEAGFDRHIEVVHKDYNGETVLPSEQLLREIGAIYGHEGPITGGAFDASFERVTPADIGGRGTLARSTTSLGATYVYLERIRGEDDLAGRVERIQTAASTGAALFLGWLDVALADEPAWPSFRATLAEGRLERDFRNLALLVWLEKNASRTGEPPTDPPDDERILVRLAAYLHEHGYLTADQLGAGPTLSDGDGPSRVLRAWLARGMGLDESKPLETLAEFASAESMDASWEAYLKASPALERVRQWASLAGISPAKDEGETEGLYSALLTIATASEPAGSAEDEVHLSLACPVEPIATNGRWSPQDRRIAWWFSVEPDAETAYLVPAIAFAAWAEPDEDFQTEHLGAAILTGDALSTYCAWHSRLGEAERVRWDEFLTSLSAQASPRDALESYEPGDDPAWTSEQNGRTLLLGALGQ